MPAWVLAQVVCDIGGLAAMSLVAAAQPRRVHRWVGGVLIAWAGVLLAVTALLA